MRYTSLFLTLILLAACNTPLEDSTQFYSGKHYGGHRDWDNFNQTQTTDNGDTLRYERLVYHRNGMENHGAAETHHIQMRVHSKDSVVVLFDSLSYNWPGGPKWHKTRVGDSLSVSYDDPRRVNFEYEEDRVYRLFASPLTFTSPTAVEQYLLHIPLDDTFQQDIFLADTLLRPFRVKVLGSILMDVNGSGPVDCYEVALVALDESTLGNATFFIGSAGEGTLKRTQTINEKHMGKRHKSIYNEYRVSKGAYDQLIEEHPIILKS